MFKKILGIFGAVLLSASLSFGLVLYPQIRYPFYITLNDLTDVDVSSPTDNYVLTYNSATETWGAEAAAGDVDTSGTPVANDFAKFTDADTIAGRSYAETAGDLEAEIEADIDTLQNLVVLEYSAETTQTPSSSFTVDWSANQVQRVTITGTNLDVTFTNPSGPCRLYLVVVQGTNASAADTIDWSNEADIIWPGNTAPTLSTGDGDVDLVCFIYDGTNYLGVANYDFR